MQITVSGRACHVVTVSESEFVCALSPALLGAVTIEVLVSGERAACSTGSACEFLLRAPQPKSQDLNIVKSLKIGKILKLLKMFRIFTDLINF